MHSKLLGVQVKVNPKIPLADFLAHLAAQSPWLKLPGGANRYFHGAMLNDYLVGLVVTKKANKTLLEVRPEQETFSLTPRSATPGSDWADFNVLVLHKATGRGLYLVHRGSCSTTSLHYVLSELYKKYRDDRIAVLTSLEADKAKHRALIKSFEGRLEFDIFVKPESFAEVIAQCKRVKSVRLKIATLKITEPIFAPLAKRAKNHFQEFTFAATTPLSDIVEGVVDAAVNELVLGGSAVTVGPDGLDGTVRFDKNLDNFGIYDLDTLADLFENFDPDKFVESTIVERITKVMIHHKQLFETVVTK